MRVRAGDKSAQQIARIAAGMGPKKASKFRNEPTVVDGFRFDSKLEAKRYGELLLLQRGRAIRELVVHPQYRLEVNGILICIYEADFAYFDVQRGTVVVEDTKGVRTALFALKKKLLKACHGIEVVEVRA